MTIDDIILQDEDRVFALNPECFVIFTGETTSDTRPFIRVGNWIDLPAEIIPLIENIIITDSMAGNPAHEQFNIDIKYLPVNRYIGSHSIVRRFLDYQKVFGLDLHNASVVDAEKDIPEISKSSAVSDRISFMGIFYRDGNFKIVHNKHNLFDLNENCISPFTDNAMHETLTQNTLSAKRYTGSGMTIIDGNPLFYKNSSYVSYLFPSRYYAEFSALGINPRMIQAVIHPSENFLPISRFLKWKHAHSSKLMIYSDYKEEMELHKSLFSQARIQPAPFTGMKCDILKDTIIEQYPHSFNIIIKQNFHGSACTTAFIKGSSGLKQIIKEKYDALFIPYSIFEDTQLLLKTSKTPFAIIDDGNRSVSKIPRLEHTVLRQNTQYEFIRSTDDNEILHLMNKYLPDDTASRIIQKDYPFIDSLSSILLADTGSESGAQIINTASLMTYLINMTSDRKYSAALKNTARLLLASPRRNESYASPGQYRFDLILSGKAIYEFAFRIQEKENHKIFTFDTIRDGASDRPENSKDHARFDRIMEDRKRLERLLSLYRTNPAAKKETDSLRSEIQHRKEIFEQERSAHPEKSQNFISGLRESVISKSHKSEQKSNPLSSFISVLSGNTNELNDVKKPKKAAKKGSKKTRNILIGTGIAVALAMSISGIIMLFHSTAVEKKLAKEQLRIQSESAERYRLKEKYNITVQDNDVYDYANKTAIRNGFAPIPVKDFRKKNPHWIFPGNVFVLADGEEVHVKDGDTLWKLSRSKLEKMYIDFYVIIEAIERDKQAGKKPDPAAVRKAESMAVTPAQKKLTASIAGSM